MSPSLINREFDDWLESRVKLVHSVRAESGVAMRSTPKDVLKDFHLHLIPFLTYKESQPVWVRMEIFGEKDVRGFLKIHGPSYAPRVYLIAGAYRKEPKEVPFEAKVVRYRAWKSKRWRSPKELHKDVEAFYMLRYR